MVVMLVVLKMVVMTVEAVVVMVVVVGAAAAAATATICTSTDIHTQTHSAIVQPTHCPEFQYNPAHISTIHNSVV